MCVWTWGTRFTSSATRRGRTAEYLSITTSTITHSETVFFRTISSVTFFTAPVWTGFLVTKIAVTAWITTITRTAHGVTHNHNRDRVHSDRYLEDILHHMVFLEYILRDHTLSASTITKWDTESVRITSTSTRTLITKIMQSWCILEFRHHNYRLCFVPRTRIRQDIDDRQTRIGYWTATSRILRRYTCAGTWAPTPLRIIRSPLHRRVGYQFATNRITTRFAIFGSTGGILDDLFSITAIDTTTQKKDYHSESLDYSSHFVINSNSDKTLGSVGILPLLLLFV